MPDTRILPRFDCQIRKAGKNIFRRSDIVTLMNTTKQNGPKLKITAQSIGPIMSIDAVLSVHIASKFYSMTS